MLDSAYDMGIVIDDYGEYDEEYFCDDEGSEIRQSHTPVRSLKHQEPSVREPEVIERNEVIENREVVSPLAPQGPTDIIEEYVEEVEEEEEEEEYERFSRTEVAERVSALTRLGPK